MEGESAAVAYAAYVLPRAYRKSRHGDRSMPKGTIFLYVKNNVYKAMEKFIHNTEEADRLRQHSRCTYVARRDPQVGGFLAAYAVEN